MSNKPEKVKLKTKEALNAFWARLKRAFSRNWGMKLTCLGLSILLWGGLISQDANLTREKIFKDVQVSAINGELLQRNGLVVVSGLDELPHIQMRVAVPQRNYNNALPNSYNVRVDLSRVTAAGEQTLPILTTATVPYGQVVWMSQTEATVQVDDYITRRRIPVQLESVSPAPAGFYAAPPSVDPATVVVSGPRKQVESIARCVVRFETGKLAAQTGMQLTAVPYVLQDIEGNEVDPHLVSVTSEGILLDTIMVEQVLYPLKTVDISLENVITGVPAQGYEVRSVSVSPTYLSVGGSADLLKSLNELNVLGSIDISDATETLVRAVKVEKPSQAQYISDEAVYVTVEVVPIDAPTQPSPVPEPVGAAR